MNEIIDIYINNGINIGNNKLVCVGSIGFDISNFNNLVFLLKKNKILVKSIELFEKRNLDYIPPDFWFTDIDLEKNYLKINEFLDSIKINLTNVYFVLTFRNNKELESEINSLLQKKF